MVVLHNEGTGLRRYWKLKGNAPPTLYINTGNQGPTTLHILMVPTPPSDYASGILSNDRLVSPVPVYNYKYKVDVLDAVPAAATITPPNQKEFGIVRFEEADSSWWPSKCTCLENDGEFCIEPTFA
jgi:hypothetical protein